MLLLSVYMLLKFPPRPPSLFAVVHLVVHGVDGERGLGRRRLAANVTNISLEA